MADAHLLFGSNIHPVDNLRRAVAELCACCRLKQTSTVWETVAIGAAQAPNFLNLAAWMETDLGAAQAFLKVHKSKIAPYQEKRKTFCELEHGWKSPGDSVG